MHYPMEMLSLNNYVSYALLLLYILLQAYRLIFEYLEAFYNTKRIHSHCDYMSPDEFERVYERTHTEAELLAS